MTDAAQRARIRRLFCAEDCKRSSERDAHHDVPPNGE
jgi:hypothetical protein